MSWRRGGPPGSWRRRLAQRAGVVALATGLALAPGAARAQQPQRPPSQDTVSVDQRQAILKALRGLDLDTVSVDSLRADSLRADSLRADSLRARPAPIAVSGPGAAADSTRPAAPPLPNDSITGLLTKLKGYTVIKYSGSEADYAADSARIVLKGPAQVQQGQQSLKADSSVVYNQTTGHVCGNGRPILAGAGVSGSSPVQSRTVCYDVQNRIGVALGATTQFTENASWYLNGNIVTKGSTRIFGGATDFTTCNLDPPHYHFAAKELKVVRGDVLVARNITLNFADVPVLWLPFMVQSLQRGRHSGLLMPQFSVNDIVRTNPGWDRRISNVGFYWAMNKYMDAEFTGEWFSNHWTSLQGNINYRVLRQFLNGNLTFRRFWRANGSRDLTLATQSSWDPTERTHLDLSANYASSSDFVRQNTWDPAELTRSIDSNMSATHRFDWGTLSLGAQRRQFLTDDHVDMTLPRLGLSLASVRLFSAPPSSAHWYNNATISGSGSLQRTTRNVNQFLPSPSQRDQSTLQGSLQSSFTLGNLSWTESVNGTRNVLGAKPAILDTTSQAADSLVVDTLAALPRAGEQRVQWSTGLNYTQRLIGTSTITPSLTMGGQLIQRDSLGSGFISAPTRLNFGASLKTDLYGFFPGVGPFSRIRHRITPVINYTYSPRPTATPLAEQVFGTSSGQEQNQITLQISQTFEAKYREKKSSSAAGADTTGADTTKAGQDTTAVGAAAGDTLSTDSTGLRHLPPSHKVTLLSINTSALAYDFVQARTGDGFTTSSVTNTITSDFLHGLSLTLTHDLFKDGATAGTGTGGTGGTTTQPHRVFAPHLSAVRASFSISNDSWLFRKLGLGGSHKEQSTSAQPRDTTGSGPEAGPGQGLDQRFGLVGSTRPGQARRMQENIGTWNANISYSLVRPRTGGGNQQINASVSFQPTINWNVRWQTGYSLSSHQFANNVLSLTRNLHEWQASLDFVKAQNGNFMFQFRVQLLDLPDLHLDYDQRGQPGAAGRTPGTTF